MAIQAKASQGWNVKKSASVCKRATITPASHFSPHHHGIRRANNRQADDRSDRVVAFSQSLRCFLYEAFGKGMRVHAREQVHRAFLDLLLSAMSSESTSVWIKGMRASSREG